MARAHNQVSTTVAVCLIVALTAGCCPKPADLTRVLMITEIEGEPGVTTRTELSRRLDQRGEVEVEAAGDDSLLNSRGIELYRVVVLGERRVRPLRPAARQAIREHVRGGGGLVVLGQGPKAEGDSAEWVKLIGGLVTGAAAQPLEVTILDAAHPVMLAMGRRMALPGRPVWIEQLDPSAGILARTSESLDDASGNKRAAPDPAVWTRAFGDGRVVVIALDAPDDALIDEWYLTLLHNSIRWAGRDLPEPGHNTLALSEEQEGYELLFNGRDLTGWTGDTRHWSVEHGELVGRAENLPRDACLRTTSASYGNFRLKCSVRLRNHCSGIQFRSDVSPDGSAGGYQASVEAVRYGSLYHQGGQRGWLVDRPSGPGWAGPAVPDGWNEMWIEAAGPRIRVMVNGIATAEYEEKNPVGRPSSGCIALQLHEGAPMEVRFRNIRIKRLD